MQMCNISFYLMKDFMIVKFMKGNCDNLRHLLIELKFLNIREKHQNMNMTTTKPTQKSKSILIGWIKVPEAKHII